MSTTNKFFTKRFYLDSVIDRHTNVGGDHFVGTEFKSYWVSKTNNTSFEANLVFNPKGSFSKIPLKLNQCIGFQNEKAEDGCIEVLTAQSGVWVDITFSQDEIIQVGSVAIYLSGKVAIDEGSSTPQTKVTSTTAIAELIPANSDRKIARLQFKSGTGNVYIGTPTELADADYQNICTKIPAGSNFEYKCTGALSSRTDASSTVFSLSQGIN